MSRAMSRDMTMSTFRLPMFRRRLPEVVIEPAPIPVPRFSIDGWTFDGTPDVARLASLSRADLRELETLLHGVAVEVGHAVHLRARRGAARAGRRARPGAVGLRGVAGAPGLAAGRSTPARPATWKAPRPAADPARPRRTGSRRPVDGVAGPPDDVVLSRFLPAGRIDQMPARRSRRLVVLDHVARTFEPGRRYAEAEVERACCARSSTTTPRCAATWWTRASWPGRVASTGGLQAGASRPDTEGDPLFDTILGLPVHALVVHAVVVLVPLAAIGLVAIAVKPAWRRPYAPIVVGLATAAVVFVPVATTQRTEAAGHAINAGGVVADQIHRHAADGQARDLAHTCSCGRWRSR